MIEQVNSNLNFDPRIMTLVKTMREQSEYLYQRTGTGSQLSDVADIEQEVTSHIDMLVKSRNYQMTVDVNENHELQSSHESQMITSLAKKYVELAKMDVRYFNALKNALSVQVLKGLVLPLPFAQWVSEYLRGKAKKPLGNSDHYTNTLSFVEREALKNVSSNSSAVGDILHSEKLSAKLTAQVPKYSTRNMVFTQILYVLKKELNINSARLSSPSNGIISGYEYIAKEYETTWTKVRDNSHFTELNNYISGLNTMKNSLLASRGYIFIETWSFLASDLDWFVAVSDSVDNVVGLPEIEDR